MMSRKRIEVSVFVVLVLLLLAAPIIGGCARAPTATPTPTPTGPAAWPKDIAFLGGPDPTTTMYLVGAYWADLLRREYGVRATPVTGTTEEGLFGVAKGAMAAGMSAGPAALQALKGEGPFADAGPLPVRLLAATTSDLYLYIVVLKGSGINSIADLRGKKISADYKGVAYHTPTVIERLAAYGVSEKDVTIGAYARAPEALTAVASRVADAGFLLAPSPVGFMTEFFMTQDALLLPLSSEAVKRLTDKFPFLKPITVPAGTYKGNDKDVPSVATVISWVVHKDLPDDLVYQLLKYEYHPTYRADFEKVHVVLRREHTLERSVKNPLIPFHAGAVKFYKDMGVWTAELDKWQKDSLKKLGQSR